MFTTLTPPAPPADRRSSRRSTPTATATLTWRSAPSAGEMQILAGSAAGLGATPIQTLCSSCGFDAPDRDRRLQRRRAPRISLTQAGTGRRRSSSSTTGRRRASRTPSRRCRSPRTSSRPPGLDLRRQRRRLRGRDRGAVRNHHPPQRVADRPHDGVPAAPRRARGADAGAVTAPQGCGVQLPRSATPPSKKETL